MSKRCFVILLFFSFVIRAFANTANYNVDITTFVNRGFRDKKAGDGIGGWTDQGSKDLRGIKVGIFEAAGLPFNVIDPIKNNGRSVIALRRKGSLGFVSKVTIPVNRKCNQIYILQTAAWLPRGQKAGLLRYEYADGSVFQYDIIGGKNVSDWKGGGFVSDAALIPLNDLSQRDDKAFGFVASFRNPHPELIIKNIILNATQSDNTTWLVLSIILGRGSDCVQSYLAGLSDNQDLSGWFPFRLKNGLSPNAAVDLSFLLDAPAGKHGFLKSKQGHFFFEDGKRIRFLGINIHANNTLYPSHAQAQKVAATLARYGINIVRFHLCESVLIDHKASKPDLFVCSDKLEKWDYFIKCLKEEGIYILLDSVMGLSGRRLEEKDGVPGYKDYYAHRPWVYYAPELEALGNRYMLRFLTRKNLYTGNSLLEEPAVAMLMLINEQTMFFDWNEAKKGTPVYYKKLLQNKYNKWLLDKYKNRADLAQAFTGSDGKCLLKPHEDPQKGTVEIALPDLLRGRIKKPTEVNIRLTTTVEFLKYIQTGFYQRMKKQLIKLGCKIPIGGSNIIYDTAALETELEMDYTCQNVYYEHVKRSPDNKSYLMLNEPLVDINLLENKKQLIAPTIAAVKLDALPIVSTETDIMWPNEWRSTYLPALASTAALQDWDAIFHFAYAGGYGLTWNDIDKAERILFPTVEFNDPAIMGLMPVASLIFLGEHVTKSKNLVKVIYSDKDRVSATKRLRENPFPFNYLTFVSRVEGSFKKSADDADIIIGDGKAAVMKFDTKESVVRLDAIMKKNKLLTKEQGINDGSLVSDTREIIRDWSNSLLIINTSQTQGFSGFPAKPVKLDDVEIECSTSFASVFLSSLDGKKIADSSRMLLTAVGRARNNEDTISHGKYTKSNSGTEYGRPITCTPAKKGKVVVEPIVAVLKLSAGKFRITPLNPDMSKMTTEQFSSISKENKSFISIGNRHNSIWYLVERE